MINKPSKILNVIFNIVKIFFLVLVLPLAFVITLVKYFDQPSKSESNLLTNAKLTVACKNHGGRIVEDNIDPIAVDCRNGKRIIYYNLYGDEVLEEFNKLKEGIKK